MVRFGIKAVILMIIVSLLVGLGAGYAVLPHQTEEVMAYTPQIDGAPNYLFVQQATSGSLIRDTDASTYTLTLNNVASQVQYFSDRPQRMAGQSSMTSFVAGWDSHGFGEDPPNAALVLLDAENQEDTMIVELTNPIYDSQAETLQYTVTVIDDYQGDGLAYHSRRADTSLPEQFGRVNLFIDETTLSGYDVTVTYYDCPSTMTYSGMEICSALAAINDDAKTYLRNVDYYSLSEALANNDDHFLEDAPSDVILIGRHGTKLDSTITEFDVYFALCDAEAPRDPEFLKYVFGYTITIHEGVSTVFKSPHNGVVSASGDWSSVNGTSVSQGETLFNVYSATGRCVSLQLSDILDETLPLGITAKQIVYYH